MKTKKRTFKYILLSALCIISSLLFSFNSLAADNEVVIRYVQSLLPQISICAKLPSSNVDNLTVRLGNENLEVTAAEQLDNNCPKRIYVLLDSSTSMRLEYFNATKKAITQFIDDRGHDDTVVLVIFGTGEPQFFENEKAKTALESLQPNKEGTELNEAILSAVKDAQNQEYNKYSYMYAILLTDGAEYSKGSTTDKEISEQFKRQPLALFGLCPDFAENNNMQNLRSISYSSGGTFETYSTKNIYDKLMSLQNEAEDVWILTAKAKSNISSEEKLSIKSNQTTAQISYISQSAIDNTPPKIVKWSYNKDSKDLVLNISEAINNNSVKKENICLLSSNGNKIYPDSIWYDEKETLTLHFNTSIPNGKYTVSAETVTDNSDNRNPLSSLEIDITNSYSKAIIMFAQYWYVFVIIIILISILIVLIIFLKKNKIKNFNDILTLYRNKRIIIKTPSGKKIIIFTEDKNGTVSKTEYTIVGSAIFGRSEYCDIVIDDSKLSRQHFSIGIDGDKMCIQDLGSSNGTYVNGNRIDNIQVLHSGDKIFAGQSVITIEFQE